MSNEAITEAKRAKKDEFYTQFNDIQNEVFSWYVILKNQYNPDMDYNIPDVNPISSWLYNYCYHQDEVFEMDRFYNY